MSSRSELLSKNWYIPLNFFASEDEGRTELPTDQKKQKARKDGYVLKSTEINSTVTLFILFAVFFFMLSYLSKELVDIFKLQASKLPEVMSISVYSLSFAYIRPMFGYVIIFLLISFIVNFLINVIQVGFFITFKPVSPNWSRVSPNFSKWIKNSFGSLDAFFTLFKSLSKVVIISFIYYIMLKGNIGKISRISEYSLEDGISVILSLAYRICFFSFIVLIGISVLDYFFQKIRYIENLKMTKEEVKRERRGIEGDPLLRSRMRERMRKILNTNLRVVVPQADVIITNPEHFAIAIKWDSNTMLAPKVLAKGQDQIAFVIKQIAKENDIPVMENKPLARDLYANVDINEEIPREYWEVVSKLLVKVYSITKI
ncbi:flagellar biosynthesis protein FlhB [Borrelia miyamotoi]|uniref:Flagellar biosynthetic protein FlhB n=1 Tax=Borrelia miyamotoi TaxID=47466 RepID=A0AAX3JLZ1_9SPIR|nr:flagellar biosynthesis protein FlhB [Borrelia miyamotoi]QFP42047.1 flagellar biosynthesis protein FlhB [Borrelia miyamotoi]QFP48163.1 flagellar biosynthesis protein FlhB [Borrelia miyamotoi]QGT55923.1 flagellar biosynthesis protein FlhB [Borrelia miyamotoi]QGT56702.1 flagellar biosynthesis protein FlhB [Borrelia miyamotoi]WAZ71962.1 flagellar biosynthesis protein FlhB [Borrelia miyamotoi]